MKFLVFIDSYRKYIFGNLLSLCGYLFVVNTLLYHFNIAHCIPKGDSICEHVESLVAVGGLIIIHTMLFVFIIGTILEFFIRKFISSKKCEKFHQTKFYTFFENIHIPKIVIILHIIVFYIGFILIIKSLMEMY